MPREKVYDVIVVGAGPGGSSTAKWLAEKGASVLLLDKAEFPRDKVCGDGLTPQAIYWLDRLGCAVEVLGLANACITSCDLYINGSRILTGRFPQDGPYPGFCTLLSRRQLDAALAAYAVRLGAEFKGGHRVAGLQWLGDKVEVEAEAAGQPVHFQARLVIGADGANSVVARVIGNRPRNGTTAVSMRCYYEGVEVEDSQIAIYFDRQNFPGYGWVFVDDAGLANIGLGYAADETFPLHGGVRQMLADFIATYLGAELAHAHPLGEPAGWFACFGKPERLHADGVLLIGDAADLADPMSGGGIHKAMESAYVAAGVARDALLRGDCSSRSLARYEQAWHAGAELDWRAGELFLAVAKNPNLRELYLLMLQAVGRLALQDQDFQDFCSAFFVDAISRSAALSPLVLLRAIPWEPSTLFAALHGPKPLTAKGLAASGAAAAKDLFQIAGRVGGDPLANLDWGLEVATKVIELLGCYACQGLPAPSR